MSQQASITAYFSRKRKRDLVLPALKRKRLDDELLSDNKPSSTVKYNLNTKKILSLIKKKPNDLQSDVKVVKQVAKEMPTYAYNKYRSLAQTVPKGLVLPQKFKVLKEMFFSLDSAALMMYNRQEIVTWDKVKVSVQKMMKKNFELTHLAQIKQVYPDAYELRQETNIVSFADSSRRTKYELTLQPILQESDINSQSKIDVGILIKRKHHFHLKLMDIVKEHHQNFLRNLTPPIQANDDELRRWHPEFQLDLVPDISAAELPSSPCQSRLECTSAQEALEKTRGRLTKKAAIALRKVSSLTQKPSTSLNDSTFCSQELINDSQYSPQLKGLSASLLAKIRQKEADRKSMMMLRSEEDCDKLDHLRRLPEVARALRSLFVGEKKSSLPLNHISSKLSKCCPLVFTADSMDKHLRLLSEKIPSWFNVSSVRGQEYGRMMNKNLPISDIITNLQTYVKRAEEK